MNDRRGARILEVTVRRGAPPLRTTEGTITMNARSPRPATVPPEALRHPRATRALRGIKLLVAGYLGLSALTLAAVYLLRGDPAVVNDAVWVRASIVVVSAVLTYLFAAGTARGSRGAYRRLRIVSAVMTAAIAVIIAVPGPFPTWLKVEQGVCGLALSGVVVLANGSRLRGLFAGA
ncbi:membrane protein [Streptomyces noursei ATCC 11455]|nr:membrane protein [Streptomyces noursei ATCC 11455]